MVPGSQTLPPVETLEVIPELELVLATDPAPSPPPPSGSRGSSTSAHATSIAADKQIHRTAEKRSIWPASYFASVAVWMLFPRSPLEDQRSEAPCHTTVHRIR
jgi:hypothetical protein